VFIYNFVINNERKKNINENYNIPIFTKEERGKNLKHCMNLKFISKINITLVMSMIVKQIII
jgi:hypothetical protein